jgi:hypothetical protein
LIQGMYSRTGVASVPIGEMHMHLAHLAGMGCHRQAMRQSEIRDLNVFGDAREARHIRLHPVQGSGLHEGTEGIERVELLTERHGNRGRAGEFGMRADIVIPERFLEPEDIERLGLCAEAFAGRQIPFAVAVNRHRDVRADGRTDRLEPGHIHHGIGMADLHLDALEAIDLDGRFAPSMMVGTLSESQPISVL